MGRKAWPNKRQGTCEACGTPVAAQAGWVYRDDTGAWKVCCKSAVCGKQLGLAGASPESAPKRELTADGRVLMPYDAAALPLLRAMPGARFDRDASPKCWRVSLDPGDRDRLLELADELKLAVAPELRTVSEDIEALSKQLVADGLYPFQVKGVCWLRQRRRALLGDDMGLGKTVQVLKALPENGRVVVICPASLKLNWRDECKRWRPDLSPVVLSGRGSFRHPEAGEVVITNYDILPKLPRCTCKAHGQLKYDEGTWQWVCEKCSKESKSTVTIKSDPVLDLSGKGIVVVADESTAVKNYKAIRSKVFKALAVTADKVWQLSGTPMLNRPFDLYGMLQSGDMAYETFGGWKSFLRCFQGYKNRWGGYEFGEPLPETPERLRRVMLRRLKTEVLTDLPEVVYQTLTVNSLDKGLKAELDAAWGAWHDEAEAFDGLDEDGAPADLPPFEQFSKLRAKLAASRIDAMLDLVEQYEDNEQPLIVFSAHRAPIDTLAKREGWAVITGDTKAEARNDAVKRFQSGELKGIGLTIQAGGYGLTLTRGSHLLFVDLAWTPSANAQAEDRARRIGQTASSIQVTRMVSDHPLDQHVLGLLAKKTALIFKAVEAEVRYKQAPQPKPEKTDGWVEESEADQQARKNAIDEAAKAAEKAQAQKRIDKIILQEKGRQGTAPGETLELTSQVREALTEAFSFMKSVCDGAQAKDGQGFSKPDVYRTAFLAEWMATGEETAFRAAAMILCRYRRQLSKQFPILFKKAA
jgi:SWI/SNF-related matrix-associated actin-dependent regulator 1 of chromatin subfamily A